MRTTWTHKLPNQYFVCPDGQTITCPSVDPTFLRNPLVRELLGLRPAIAAVDDRVVSTLPAVSTFALHQHSHAA